MIKKYIALGLSVSFLLASLSACSGNKAPQIPNTSPLVCGYLPFSEKFSPFFVDSAYDRDVVSMASINLLTTDRNGAIIYNSIDGETSSYNGTDYTYYGISDISIDIDEVNKKTVYKIKIRDDIKFSDGIKMTSDDLIFNYYVLCDPSYTGSSTLYSTPILGMDNYRTSKENIEGIKKIDEYNVEITTDGFDASAIYNICGIIVAPLHYYGDRSLYDYENNKFGFTKGDLSSIAAKTTKPLGAGPYKFDRYENRVVYFEANENYYKGVPLTKYVQFKETDEADKIAGVGTGTIDISDPAGSIAALDEIRGYNKNGDISGDKIVTSTVDNLGYGYIGINASTVCVGNDSASEQSKNLRKAFATLFAVYREISIGSYFGQAASIINYPISNTSWAAPKKTDDDYSICYSKDIDGKQIYTSETDAKYKAALQASIGFFKAAGYTFDEASGKFTKAPDGAKLEYMIIIPAQGSGNHPTFALLEYVRSALQTIGITLTINNPSDPNELWNLLDTGKQEMWVAAWSASIDPDLYQIYHSNNIIGNGGANSNHYHLDDKELDALILSARESADTAFRKATYKACLDMILDWSVEIPVYQRQNCVLFSAQRIDTTSITPDITTYWGWSSDIEKIKMK